MNLFFQDYIGKIGTAALLLLGVITYLGIRLKVSPQQIGQFFKSIFKTTKKVAKNVKQTGEQTSIEINRR